MPKKISLEDVNNRLKSVGFDPITQLRNTREKHDFVCNFCGNKFTTTIHKVISGHTKSCGCSSIGKRKGTLNISGTFWDRLIRGAKLRDIKVEIDIEYAESLLVKQKFRCALSNIDLIVGYGPLGNITASIDRIDPTKGYTKNNIQWVHKDINWMKQDYTNKEFIEYCKKVADNNAN